MRSNKKQKAAAKRGQRRREVPFIAPSPNAVMTLQAWCALNGISLPTGRRIISRGKGPKVLQLGERRIGIRHCDNVEWQNSRVKLHL
jgi:hypothetical protein